MIQHGKPPFLECSSKGFKPFSAFYARIRARGNRSIEELYQAFKIFPDDQTGLSIKEAKGKLATNQSEAARFYSQLWNEYIDENPQYCEVLWNATGVSDIFGQYGSVCQATELWRIKFTIIPNKEWL